MPSYTEYLSDASISSSDEDDEEEEELYDPRELDYWALEDYLDKHRPPPVLEYVEKIGVVAIREAIISPMTTKIERVVDSLSVWTWKSFWRRETQTTFNTGFSHEDWDAIGSFCFGLCGQCKVDPTMDRVRSCMIRILSHGNFKHFIRCHM